MKAAVVTRYGPPEVLEIRDVPAPVPREDEVLIRVHASTVCFGDRIIRQGPLFVRSLGADDVIDYTRHDFTGDGPRYDVICDVMGKAGFPGSLRALKPGGRYLLVGFAGGLLAIGAAIARGFWAHLRGRAVFMTGPAAPVQADLELLKTLVERGELRSVVGRRFPLEEIVEAHRHADGGHKVGNLVVIIGGVE
jgi:NADPH2:quinone reductase